MLQLIQNWRQRIINFSTRFLRNHPFIGRIITICVIFEVVPILWLCIGLVIWILIFSIIFIVGIFLSTAIIFELFNRG
ncbi:hypothetical protein GLOIN_2v1621729 [Rhizophagus clarus]|uniref:Uncharacterized protein n=1 Tax=Rhizophagus clarus TaxID=94130 RepID=A0A8H3L324_9GLOM|nr:hypothetical protein GLOIN_2v1621729 [Rhizophagus clarus]